MAKVMTHTGIIRGCDARTAPDYQTTVKLRESKRFWIAESGAKYSKTTGSRASMEWPMFCLDITTVKSVEVAQ